MQDVVMARHEGMGPWPGQNQQNCEEKEDESKKIEQRESHTCGRRRRRRWPPAGAKSGRLAPTAPHEPRPTAAGSACMGTLGFQVSGFRPPSRHALGSSGQRRPPRRRCSGNGYLAPNGVCTVSSLGFTSRRDCSHTCLQDPSRSSGRPAIPAPIQRQTRHSTAIQRLSLLLHRGVDLEEQQDQAAKGVTFGPAPASKARAT